MRRLLLLVGAIVLVDTMFFAALTPLLPHYEKELDLGKGGAGVLAAMYPAGALVAGIPSGVVVARLGVKRAVLIGLVLLAGTTVAFGLADSAWSLDLARFLQGISSAFSWTGGLAWLVAATPAKRRSARWPAWPSSSPSQPQRPRWRCRSALSRCGSSSLRFWSRGSGSGSGSASSPHSSSGHSRCSRH